MFLRGRSISFRKESLPQAVKKRYAEQPVKSNPATCAADLRYFLKGNLISWKKNIYLAQFATGVFPKKTQANCGRGGGGGACSPRPHGCRLFRQPDPSPAPPPKKTFSGKGLFFLFGVHPAGRRRDGLRNRGGFFGEKTGVRGIVPESVCDGIALRRIAGYNGKNFEGSGGEDDGSVGRSARVLRGLRAGGRKAAGQNRQVDVS